MPINVKLNGVVHVFDDSDEAATALMNTPIDPEYQRAHLEDLRQQIRAYEERYGIPSHCIHEAIDNGLTETLDVVEWIFTYELYTDIAGVHE